MRGPGRAAASARGGDSVPQPRKTADDWFASAAQWRNEVAALRKLALAMGLDEEMKWGMPCYTHAGKNVVGIGSFKSYFGLWFYQGALLEDPDGVLHNAQAGKTKAMRQWRMQAARDARPAAIRRYLQEAIRLAEAGREIPVARSGEFTLPDELAAALKASSKTRSAFEELSPGRQREYASFVAEAKREDTRRRRVDKILPMILRGVGLNDRYR